MEMTALGPFTNRLAGQLSGGMKQKLGLACTLVRSPELLLLDEPTVGVDPLSRRELWEIILHLVHEQGLVGAAQHVLPGRGRALRACRRAAPGQGAGRRAPRRDVSRLAAGRTFLAEPPAGQKARARCKRVCSTIRDVVDAVPEGGRVRVVEAKRPRRRPSTASEDPLAEVTVLPTPAAV